MGVDLKLLPLETDPTLSCGYAHSMLELDRDRGLWEQISKSIPVMRRPGFKFHCFVATRPDGATGYGELMEDCYGAPLQWAKAGKLAEVIEKYMKTYPDHFDQQTQAAVAYIKALSPETLIALYWH